MSAVSFEMNETGVPEAAMVIVTNRMEARFIPLPYNDWKVAVKEEGRHGEQKLAEVALKHPPAGRGR